MRDASAGAYSQPMDADDAEAIRAALRRSARVSSRRSARPSRRPDQMTYGSQAAAASQVFEQQRDLALRDRASQQLGSSTRRSRGSTTGRSGRACAAAGRSPPARLEALPWAAHCIDCQRHRRPRTPMTDDAEPPSWSASTPSARRPSACAAIAIRTPLVAFGPPGERRFLKAEIAPADRRVQDPRRLRRRRVAPARRARRGVITYSSGNHAQGVARAARLLGRAGGRRHAVRRAGDQARAGRGRRRRDRHRRDRQRRAPARSPRRIAAERGLAIIPPFDDDRIIAGQGTVGLEIVEDLPDLAAVLVPIGGGGLASGVAAAVKALRPAARVIGVEPELAADARESLGAWRDRPLAGRARLADDRRRHADAGARPAHVRPPAAPTSTAIVTVVRGRDRGRRPAGGRAEPARRRAVRRAGRSPRWRSTARELGLAVLRRARSWRSSAAGTSIRSAYRALPRGTIARG